MAFALIPFAELGPPRASGAGRTPEVYRDRDRVVVASEFQRLYWTGRALYGGHRPRHRVAVYIADALPPVAYFDLARYAILDVAFHPSEPVLAIGTGSYDGGYSFEGELWWWNWVTGEHRSLLGAPRMVERCRFDGDQISIVLLPPNDDEYDPGSRFTAVIDPRREHTTDGDDRELLDLPPVDPDTLGFSDRLAQRTPEVRAAELARLGLEPRAPIWDLAVLDDGRLVAAFDDGAVEVFRATGERVARHQLPGRAVQLLRLPDQLLVNVTSYQRSDTSTLYVLRDHGLVPWRQFETGRMCSVDRHGRVLARSTGDGAPDEVLAPDGRVLLEARLGHYDCFNHSLRIDHAEDLYFLQGRPSDQHQHKHVYRIDQHQLLHEVCAWDGTHEHLMCGSAVLADGDLVRCVRVYDPSANRGLYRIERMSLAGEVAWRIKLRAEATAIVEWPAAGAIVFTLVDATLGIVDIETGEPHQLGVFMLDRLPTVVTALAVHDETLIMGTVDGRALMYAMR